MGGWQTRRHQIVLPLGKAMTVKHSYRISGQLPDLIVDQRDDSPQERHRSDMIEKIAWAIIRASRGETTFADGAWFGSEVGSTCFDLYFDVKRMIPVLRAIDPIGVFEVEGVDDPHDFQRVYRTWEAPVASVHAAYRDQLFRGKPIPVGDISASKNVNGVDMVQIVQLCDREKLIRFVMTKDGCLGLYEFQHNYGFTPYVVIANIGPAILASLLRLLEALGWAAFVASIPFSLAVVVLDFEMRWYRMTDRSLRIREGILVVREKTMTFANIQRTTVRQGPLQRLLGIADVEVRSAGGGSGKGDDEEGKDLVHVGHFRGVDDEKG